MSAVVRMKAEINVEWDESVWLSRDERKWKKKLEKFLVKIKLGDFIDLYTKLDNTSWLRAFEVTFEIT